MSEIQAVMSKYNVKNIQIETHRILLTQQIVMFSYIMSIF